MSDLPVGQADGTPGREGTGQESPPRRIGAARARALSGGGRRLGVEVGEDRTLLRSGLGRWQPGHSGPMCYIPAGTGTWKVKAPHLSAGQDKKRLRSIWNRTTQYCLVRGQDCPRPLDGTTACGMRGDNGHRHGVWTGRPTDSWTLRGTGGADGDCRCRGRRIRPGVLPDFRLDTSETMTLSATRLPASDGL